MNEENGGNFEDVLAFHRKFGLPNPDQPTWLPEDVKQFRVKFMEEEPGWHLGYLAPEDEARVMAELRGEEIPA